MAYEKVDISVLVVDDDDASLSIVASILNSLGYKALTANSVLKALEILREFQGFIDLLITELHMSGMEGFEFQKCVQNEFNIPVIVTSADARSSVISKTLEIGAAHYILKPFSTDDFKDIWQYAMAARKNNLTIEDKNECSTPGDNVSTQNVNSETSPGVNKKKRKYCHRSSIQVIKDGENGESSRLVKKPKVVWTAYLHNRFLRAIKQIGLDKAVPKTILQVMNVPNLTRENVASHLQKYRIFLKKVSEKGFLESLSNRDLRSRFASGISESMIRDLQAKAAKSHDPVQQYMERIAHQSEYGGIANVVNSTNHVSRSTPPGRLYQFPYPSQIGLNMMLQKQHSNSFNQARLGVQSSIGTNNIQQNMLRSYANQPYYAQSSRNNAGALFPSPRVTGHGFSGNGLRGGMNHIGHNKLMYPNYGSLGNNNKFSYCQGNLNMRSLNNSNNNLKFSYGQGNLNMGSLNISNNNLPWTTSTYNPKSNIQLNGGTKMAGNGTIQGWFNSNVGIMDSVATNNGFGLINETTQQNKNKNVAPWGEGDSGLAQGAFAFSSASACSAGEGSSTTNNATPENIPSNTQLPQQFDGDIAENFVSEDDFSDLFMMLDDMDLLIEPEENPKANDLSCSTNDAVQNLEQVGGEDGDVDIESLDRLMVNDVSAACKSITFDEPDWDLELIETLFGEDFDKKQT